MFELTAEEVEFYHENGYLIKKRVFDADQVALLNEVLMDILINTEGRSKRVWYGYHKSEFVDPANPLNVQWIMDHALADDIWFDHIADAAILIHVSQLLGSDVNFHNGKILNKPPRFSNRQSWHQDFTYQNHDKPSLLSALTYLTPTSKGNAATEVMAGSHKRSVFENKGGTIDESKLSDFKIVFAEADPGDVLYIDTLVVHRVGDNNSDKSHHAIVNQYKTADAIDMWGNKHAYAEIPLVRKSAKVVANLTGRIRGDI